MMQPFISLVFVLLISLQLSACGGGSSGGGSEALDSIKPFITLLGSAFVTVEKGTTYSDAGATASDNLEGDITDRIVVLNPVDTSRVGTYTVTYNVSDLAGNAAEEVIRQVCVSEAGTASDCDGDFIPDDVEIYLGMDPHDSDQNDNGIMDGLETQGTYGDPFFDKQWHLRSTGSFTNNSRVATVAGNDLDLFSNQGVYTSYMGYNAGSPIIVQVVDTGVDADHEDLIGNMDLSRSYSGTQVGDPSARYTADGGYTHGTGVAGIIGAEAFNGKGLRGIAPFAKIAGSNWLQKQTYASLEYAWYSGAGANEIAVSNNSWGSYYDSDTIPEDIMKKGTRDLRDGKGRVYVFAAGNDGYDVYGRGNANLQYTLSNRYAIAVAALKNDNTRADYSTPGSNILVSGYSGNFQQDSPTISTTTVMGTSSHSGDINTQTTWSDDLDENYTFGFNGTSAASPNVAGAVALLLEACPDLTWRDVRYLLATKASKVDASRSTWIQNGAGLWHSIDYGFGLVNLRGMIEQCKDSSYSQLPAEISATVSSSPNLLIPDNGALVTTSVNMSTGMTVEWVEVTVDNDSTYASDYKVELTSPSGTKTTLMTSNTDLSTGWMDGGFRLSSAAMLGESSLGSWQISFTDELSGDSGTLKEVSLKIYGH
jgi:subtilisin-like proprotein convertase family protein